VSRLEVVGHAGIFLAAVLDEVQRELVQERLGLARRRSIAGGRAPSQDFRWDRRVVFLRDGGHGGSERAGGGDGRAAQQHSKYLDRRS
jgi:hypothetical protein